MLSLVEVNKAWSFWTLLQKKHTEKVEFKVLKK